MNTDRELTRIVQSWLDDTADVLPEHVLHDVLDRLPSTPQRGRRRWSRPGRNFFMSGFVTSAVAAIAAVAVIGAGVGLYLSRPNVPGPGESRSPRPTETPAVVANSPIAATPAPSATVVVGSGGLVAYAACTDPALPDCGPRLWVVNSDGSDAHELLPGVPGYQRPAAWSPDGSQLWYWSSGTEPGDDPANPRPVLGITDASGSEPEVLSKESLCPPEANNCHAGWGAAISPDGTRFAYTIKEGPDLRTWSIGVMDVPSRQVTKLESTRTDEATFCCDGYYEPRWSPDGTRITFSRPTFAVFTVNVDGSDLRQVTPANVFATAPRWSPDGSLIVAGSGGVAPRIYTVRPDGGGFRTIASNSHSPEWTRDGRIVFLTRPGAPVAWIMDADGRNAAPLDASSIPALTAAGCVVCAYPEWARLALWQPSR